MGIKGQMKTGIIPKNPRLVGVPAMSRKHIRIVKKIAAIHAEIQNTFGNSNELPHFMVQSTWFSDHAEEIATKEYRRLLKKPKVKKETT